MRYIYFLMTFAFVSCSIFRHYEPEQLVNQRNNYTETAINVGGYYQGKNTKMVYVFFRNGVVGGGTSYPFASNENLESEILRVLERELNKPESWGSFRVEEDKTIVINKWINTGSWFGDFPHAIIKGRVIIDSIFILEEWFLYATPEKKYSKSDTFYFRPMKTKPDSTNKYFEKWYK